MSNVKEADCHSITGVLIGSDALDDFSAGVRADLNGVLALGDSLMARSLIKGLSHLVVFPLKVVDCELQREGIIPVPTPPTKTTEPDWIREFINLRGPKA